MKGFEMKELEAILNRLHEHADFREMFLFERALNDAEALFIGLIKENECLNERILDLQAIVNENQEYFNENHNKP